MKIAVFGATGTVGRHVVLQALAAGHEVTAFTRSSEKLTGALSAETDKEIPLDRLQVAEGDVLEDGAAVETAVRDKDVVIVALGAGLRGRVRAEGTRKIIEAMQKTGTASPDLPIDLGSRRQQSAVKLEVALDISRSVALGHGRVTNARRRGYAKVA